MRKMTRLGILSTCNLFTCLIPIWQKQETGVELLMRISNVRAQMWERDIRKMRFPSSIEARKEQVAEAAPKDTEMIFYDFV